MRLMRISGNGVPAVLQTLGQGSYGVPAIDRGMQSLPSKGAGMIGIVDPNAPHIGDMRARKHGRVIAAPQRPPLTNHATTIATRNQRTRGDTLIAVLPRGR